MLEGRHLRWRRTARGPGTLEKDGDGSQIGERIPDGSGNTMCAPGTRVCWLRGCTSGVGESMSRVGESWYVAGEDIVARGDSCNGWYFSLIVREDCLR